MMSTTHVDLRLIIRDWVAEQELPIEFTRLGDQCIEDFWCYRGSHIFTVDETTVDTRSENWEWHFWPDPADPKFFEDLKSYIAGEIGWINSAFAFNEMRRKNGQMPDVR